MDSIELETECEKLERQLEELTKQLNESMNKDLNFQTKIFFR
jgi:phage-related protein